MKKISKRTLMIAACSLVLTTGAFLTGQALADGIPGEEALTYSGTLTDDSGAPLTGDHEIEVRFWDAASGGGSLCSSDEESVTLNQGRFSVALPDDCTDEVGRERDIWVEVVVDSTSLGRAKAGAVPYAVEANHAMRTELPALVSIVQDLADERINLGNATPGEWTVVPERTLTFTKRHGASSPLRITYQDTLGTLGTRYNGCQWRILVDDQQIAFFSAADLGNVATHYNWRMSNAARVAWAMDVPSGEHTVTVEWTGGSGAWVAASSDGTTECLAGWNTDGNFLSVEEIP